jgi:hypothetical protein
MRSGVHTASELGEPRWVDTEEGRGELEILRSGANISRTVVGGASYNDNVW